MGTIEMKMAKGSNADVDAVTAFMLWLEEFCEYGTDAENQDDNDEDRKISDEQAMERIKEEFSRWSPRRHTAAGSWRRVVMGFQILRDNVCDPDADTLEWNPELKALIEAADSPALEPHPFTADAWQLQELADV